MLRLKLQVATILALATLAAAQSTAGLIPTVDANSAQTADPTFPDGVEHDFGKVQAGSQAYHAFRIVNTTRLPLRILGLRSAASVITARPTTSVLLPKQEGRIEISLDTSRFRGNKTVALFLTLDNGKEVRFVIRAEALESQR